MHLSPASRFYLGCHDNNNVQKARVYFYDMVNPLSPTYLWGYSLVHHDAGGTAIAKLRDGRFLMAVARHDANVIDFYLSGNPSITGFLSATGWQITMINCGF